MSTTDETQYTASPSPTSTAFTSPPSKAADPHACPASVLSKTYSLDTDYKGSVIPPSTKERRKHRTLVLCFDGTGDQFDADNSNVVNFFSLLKKGDNKQQLVYYQVELSQLMVSHLIRV